MQLVRHTPTRQRVSDPKDPDATERRHLTVLFCDLEGSTELATRLDPEDLLDLVRAFQRAVADVFEGYGGHIAQYLGDGLLVYFGYPTAHEDDAERAVRAGLEAILAVNDLNPSPPPPGREPLAVRVGIHTGPVAVGAMGGGSRRETLAIGSTANIASRIQGVAKPRTVAVSDATLHLLRGTYDTRNLGAQILKGVDYLVHVHQVIQRPETPRFDSAPPATIDTGINNVLLSQGGEGHAAEGQCQ